jgi:hypothetical protein
MPQDRAISKQCLISPGKNSVPPTRFATTTGEPQGPRADADRRGRSSRAPGGGSRAIAGGAVVSHLNRIRIEIHSNSPADVGLKYHAGRWSCRVAPPWVTGASEARHAYMHGLSSLYTRTASAKRDARHPRGVESSVTPYVYIACAYECI